MPTLKGKWYFKEVIDIETLCDQNIMFSYNTGASNNSFFRSKGEEFCYFAFGDLDYGVVYGTDQYFPYGYGSLAGWSDQDFRLIEFLYPIEISEEFYNWFTKNAVPLTIEGTWRFNKNLVLPTATNINGRVFLDCDFSSDWTNGHYSEYTQNLQHITCEEDSLYAYISDSDSDETVTLWTANTGWVSDAARLLTFSPNTELDGEEFALWFYENAHSTELKLYSECYIAETADKIRECTNNSTLTFKASDLADGVQTVYNAGYSQGIAESGDSEISLQTKTVNPSGSTQTVKADSGYDGLSSVTVSACSGTAYISDTYSVNVIGKAAARISSTERNKLIASNIKSGVNILGVTGTYDPSPNTATVQITAAGTSFNEGEGFEVTYYTNGKACFAYATIHHSLSFQADMVQML